MAQDNSDEIAPPGKEESKTATPVVLPKKRKRTKSKKARTSINNPLAGRPPARLKDDVHRFAEKYELQNISDLLYRGARVAQDPGEFESDDPPASESEEPPVSESALELSKEEREALRVERKSTFWQQTKELKVIVVTCSIAAILQGWDQASINGANLGWPAEFGLHIGANGTDKRRNSHDIWIFAFVNAAPYLFAGLIGAWLSDPLNKFGGPGTGYGRRRAIFASALLCFFSVIGSACTHNWGQLLACRILLGIGMGVKAAVVPIFAAETSPAHIRGSLVMNWQLFVAFGIFLGFSANLAVFNIKSLAWRLQLAIACLPAIPLLILIFICPESPRFLIKTGEFHKCYKALCYLNKTPLQAARELYYIHAQMEAETEAEMEYRSKQQDSNGKAERGSAKTGEQHQTYQSLAKATRFPERCRQLISVPRIRHATYAAVIVMISQQLCGVNVIAFYSSTLLSSSNASSLSTEKVSVAQRKALWLSWGFGLTNFLIDIRGRRFLLLSTIPFLALTLLGAGFSFKISENSRAHIGVIAFFIILFAIFYSPGLGPVPFTLSAEVFPLINREVGMSFAVFWNLLGAGILSLTVPFLNDSLRATGLLCLFAGLNVVTFALVFFLVYETKSASLEEMNGIFAVETRTHIKYQLDYVLPWAYNRYIRRTKDEDPLDSLFIWAQNQQTARE